MFYSKPENSKTDPTDKLLRSVKAYIELCCPNVDPKTVFMGNQNRISLPPDCNEYCIFSIVNTAEHGTPRVSESYNEETGAFNAIVKRIVEVIVQVDFYSDNVLKAQERAQTLSMTARSVVGSDFFKSYDVALLNADMPQNTTVVIDSEQYVQRFTVDLHLMYTHSAEFGYSYFDSVNAELKEVDSSFPPDKV